MIELLWNLLKWIKNFKYFNVIFNISTNVKQTKDLVEKSQVFPCSFESSFLHISMSWQNHDRSRDTLDSALKYFCLFLIWKEEKKAWSKLCLNKLVTTEQVCRLVFLLFMFTARPSTWWCAYTNNLYLINNNWTINLQ